MDTKFPIVSIVMPAYNAEQFIGQAIESVLSQTFQNWKLIVVDDCSGDKSASIVERYAKEDSRIFLIKNVQNSGSPAKARNIGLKVASGKYVAFLDSDDWWDERKLQVQIDAMIGGDFAICHTGGYFVYDDGMTREFVPRCKSGNVFGELLKQYELKTLSVIMDKAKLDVLTEAYFDENIKIGEDYHLFMRLASTAKVLTIYDKLYFYRVHSSSVTRSSPNRLWEGMEKFKDWLRENNPVLFSEVASEMLFVDAKIAYYKARFYMSKTDCKNAKRVLKPFIFLDWRYFVLYILAILPPFFWNSFHKLRKN